MREGRPSVTAAMVSLARGIGLSDRVEDPLAAAFLPPPVGTLLASYRWLGPARAPMRLALRLISLGAVDHIALRMAAIDRAMEGAFAAGAEQLVILGAGLDARAFRQAASGRGPVYEVDHPATQAYKRARAARLDGPRAPIFVPVDFERQRLGAVLADAGHDPRRPTFWIWEGVTMYISPVATAACLGEIAASSAPGSRLAATYATPAMLPPWLPRSAALVGAVEASFELLSEPLRGLLPSHEMRSLLTGAGLSLLSDTDSTEWAAEAGVGRARFDPLQTERLVVAEQRPAAG